MCIAVPVRVLSSGGNVARCVDRTGVESDVDVALVGDVQPGEWLLVFLGTAREIVPESRALDVCRALDALEAIMRGDLPDIEAAFPDLAAGPQLPEFLR
jgi:hydrogenase expression/formation protein HypC